MALVKAKLSKDIYDGLYRIFIDQSNKATSGDENEKPEDVIKHVASSMADVISSAVEAYVKSGDIIVGPTNVQVTSTAPGTPATVAPLQPAKLI